MILYIQSKAFPCRSFTVRVQAHETIARVRAQLLHILYEIGKADHQFRLRFKGQYLRDAYLVEDYGIVDNAILKMVPLSKKAQSVVDLQALEDDASVGSGSSAPVGGMLADIKQALLKEISVFEYREKLIYHFKGLQYLQFMGVWLSFLTTYWYSGLWTFLVWAVGSYFCPSFTRFTGFIGRQSIYKNEFCFSYGTLALLNMVAAMYFAITEWTRLVYHGCKDWVFVDDCSHVVVYSAIFFSIKAMCLLISSCLAWTLLWNMKVGYGDYIEKHLVRTRDIEEIMKTARTGRVKEKRIAAFEIATMAASGDDNKFRIVAEGGLELLIHMALSKDTGTQEHAVEALAELLTVPVIQDNFVEMGGVKTLTALLHSSDNRLVYQAATAISYIVADSEENKYCVSEGHGLNDLAYAAKHANVSCQRLVSGIFLDLTFNADIRMHMSSLNTPAQALIHLSSSKDPETQRFALQTLELLALESANMICAQEELLPLLLKLPLQTVDIKVFTLAGKILLYYAENRETCEQLMDHPSCKDSLFQYARTNDAVLQKVIVKVIYCMIEVTELKHRARHLELDEVLKYIQEHAADREVWDMADQALAALASDSDSLSLPTMTAAEKLDKMDPKIAMKGIESRSGSSNGSRGSIRSNVSFSSLPKKSKFA